MVSNGVGAAPFPVGEDEFAAPGDVAAADVERVLAFAPLMFVPAAFD
jgi:hypothetical protein